MNRPAGLRLSARVLDENPIPLSQPSKLGADRSQQTLDRWADEGLISPVTNKRVKLEVVYRCKVLCTSAAALKRFDLEINGFTPRKRKGKRARVSPASAA